MRFCVALLFACLLPTPLHAQGFPSWPGTSPSGSQPLLEANRVEVQVVSAFRRSSVHLLSQRKGTKLPEERLLLMEQAVEASQASFADYVENALLELEGDGVLEASEVSQRFQEGRSLYLEELDQVLLAHLQGVEPPPLGRDFASALDYGLELLRYTLLVRNELQDWVAIFGLLFVLLLLPWLLHRLFPESADPFPSRSPWKMTLRTGMIGPLCLVAAGISLYGAGHILWVPGVAESALGKILSGSLVVALFWFFWNACVSLSKLVVWIAGEFYDRRLNSHTQTVLCRMFRILVGLCFLLVLIHQIFRSDLGSLLTGLGVLGILASFLLRGSIENMIATLTILGDRPFRVGDLICYQNFWGHIEDIGFRSTCFRTFDGHMLRIPNQKLIQDAIHNIGERPSIRRRFRLSLTYETSPAKVQEAIEIVRSILEEHVENPAGHQSHVVFEDFGAYDLRLLIQYYHAPPEYWAALELDTRINLEILTRFNQAGIDFAYPTETAQVHFPEGLESPFRPRNASPPLGASKDAEDAVSPPTSREEPGKKKKPGSEKASRKPILEDSVDPEAHFGESEVGPSGDDHGGTGGHHADGNPQR